MVNDEIVGKVVIDPQRENMFTCKSGKKEN